MAKKVVEEKKVEEKPVVEAVKKEVRLGLSTIEDHEERIAALEDKINR